MSVGTGGAGSGPAWINNNSVSQKSTASFAEALGRKHFFTESRDARYAIVWSKWDKLRVPADTARCDFITRDVTEATSR